MTTHRVIAIPELLRNIFFSFSSHRDTYHATLVCRTWSEIGLDALWYEVDDLCRLFNLLSPLTNGTPWQRTFVRSPDPEDWIKFEKYSRRVRKLIIGFGEPVPSQSVFDDICRTRIQHEVLPNLWNLQIFGDIHVGALFLHRGIRDLTVRLDVLKVDQVSSFVRHASSFSCNVVTLEIRTGPILAESTTNISTTDPVGCIVEELSSWLAQLQDLQEVILPRFWLTTRICRVLSRLPRLLRVLYSHMHGGGNPLDTLNFKPISDPGVDSEIFFPSLVILYQNAPFSQITQFISSWKGSSNLVDLTLASQLLETPDSFRSALLVITDRCPLLLGLGLTSLITPYLDHPRAAPSRLRITLDDLLPLLKLNHLHSLDISHALPLALTNDDFLVLIRGWPGMERLCLGSDPYPLDSRIVHVARSPLSLSPTHNADGPDPANAYPILGLWHAIRSLRIYCPYLTGLFLFGIDDFPTPDEQARITADEPPPNPFPYLTTVSFSMSLLTSEKTSVALALSQYLLPDTTLTPNKPWGGDQDSEYLSHLNLKPLFSSYDQLSGELQEVMDSAEPTLPEPLSSFSPSLTLDEPIGFNGVLDEETDAELERRVLLWDGVAEFLPVLSRARRDERIKADKVMFSW